MGFAKIITNIFLTFNILTSLLNPMINPRDLFEQIGFVVDSPSQTSPYKSKRQTEYN